MAQKGLLVAGALLGFLAVAFGAFGSHALRDRLDATSLDVYDIAVRYQLVHALAAVIAAVAISSFHGGGFMMGAGWLFVFGTVFFSGSLYLLAFTGLRLWGMLTPVGGLLLLGGWLAMAIAAWRS